MMTIMFEYFRPEQGEIESLRQQLVRYSNGHYGLVINRTNCIGQKIIEKCKVAKQHALEVLGAEDKDGWLQSLISFHRDDLKVVAPEV